MKIETRSWVPTTPVKEAGLIGHEVVPDGIMQTTPMLATVTETPTEWDSVPLEPVICMEKVPVIFAATVRAAVPEPVMLVGFTTAPIPLE
jgi:hypothetical protein